MQKAVEFINRGLLNRFYCSPMSSVV